VGALARCLDWGVRQGIAALTVNPLRQLPRRYATYNDRDTAAARVGGGSARVDVERDRRLQPGEEPRIRAILGGDKPDGRERPLVLRWQGALECLFDLALESAMRMRELYTLSKDQVVLSQRTIFLDKTKNGDKRQVPLSSTAVKALRRYEKDVTNQTRGMEPLPCSRSSSGASSTRRAARTCAFMIFRHEATSRLFERTTLSDLEISRITGHKDPRVLRRYSNLRGSDLAAKLW
jgi:integrase